MFGLAAGGAAYTCFLLWVNDLQLVRVEVQLKPVVAFVNGFDQTWEKNREPVMSQLNKLSTSIDDLRANVKYAKAVGFTLLGFGAAWWLAEVAGGRRSPPRSPPPT